MLEFLKVLVWPFVLLAKVYYVLGIVAYWSMEHWVPLCICLSVIILLVIVGAVCRDREEGPRHYHYYHHERR